MKLTLREEDDLFGSLITLGFHPTSGSPTPAAPTNAALPTLSGSPFEGETLEVSTGAWSGYPSIVITYQWTADAVAIPGETANSYLVEAGRIGETITCEVTATNSEGAATATPSGLLIIANAFYLLIDDTNYLLIDDTNYLDIN